MSTKRSTEIDAKFFGIEINSINGKCGIDDCGRRASGRGVCLMHYKRIARFGRGFRLNKLDVKKHPLYSIWFSSKKREVLCEDWLDFRAFTLAVGERPSEFHQLKRLDTSMPYAPQNFEWKSVEFKTAIENGVVVRFPYRSSKDETLRRDRMLKNKYKISLVEYAEMLSRQNNGCAICGDTEVMVIKRRTFSLAVDHDHSTGKIRGILCHGCNRALGLMKDDPSRLRAAADYLELTCEPASKEHRG